MNEIIQSIAILLQGTFNILVAILLIKMSRRVDNIVPKQYVQKPRQIFKPSPKETEEQKRQRILNENIENYDGTPKGQVKL